MVIKWEQIDPTTERAKIKGGWLVRFSYFYWDDGSEFGYGYGYGGMTFVPDPEYKWNEIPYETEP